jgi:hypothetical protein
MNPDIERLKLIFIAVFAVAIVGVAVWQVGWILPQKKCEGLHRWWDASQRVCAMPVMVTDFTRRPAADKQAEAAAKAAIGRAPAPAAKN